MIMTVQTGCSNRSNVEAGLEPFFALHPTEDLNELFRALRRIDSNTWIISTSIDRGFERDDRDISTSESMELWMNGGTTEIVGEYTISFDYFEPFDPERHVQIREDGSIGGAMRRTEEDERRIYPVVLTPEGIRVPEEIEIDNETRERIENFKLVIQLIDLSEESRSTLSIESSNQSQNRMTTGIPTFHLGYNIEDEHPILQTIRQEFNIPDDYELSRSHMHGALLFQGGIAEPWALTERSDNTRLFRLNFRNPSEEFGGTTLTSFMRITRNERSTRTEAETITTIKAPEAEVSQIEEEEELNFND